MLLFLPATSYAAKSDYEVLVERNLELREQLQALEQKYAQLENERNVLIVHIRNLQEEKEKLIPPGAGAAAQKEGASGDELKAAFSEVSKELGLVAKERDRLKKEFARFKEDQSRSEAAIKAMEEEKVRLSEQLDQIKSTFQASQAETTAAVGSLQTEKTSLADQVVRLKETFEKEKEDLLARQARVIEEERNKLHEEVSIKEQSLEEETKNLRARVEKDVEESRKKSKETIKALEKEKTQLAALKEGLGKENVDLMKRVESLEKEKKRLGEDLAWRALEVDRLQKDWEEKAAANEKQWAVERISRETSEAKLTVGLDKARADLKAKEDAFKEEKAELEKNRLALEGQLKEARAKLKASEKQWAVERIFNQAREAKLQAAAEKSAGSQKRLAVELAFYKIKEAELTAERREILLDQDQLKARLDDRVRASQSLEEEKKNLEDKWRQSLQKIEALHGELEREQNVFLKGQKEREVRLSGLARSLEAAQKRVEKLERLKRELTEKIKVGQVRRDEQENFVSKLITERSSLEAKLVKEALAADRKTFTLFSGRKKALTPAGKQKLDMHFNLAVAYDKTGMYEAEEGEYLECLKIDPNDANVHYNLGILYDDKLNDNAKAIKYYQKFLRLCPLGEDAEQVRQWIMYAEQQQRL